MKNRKQRFTKKHRSLWKWLFLLLLALNVAVGLFIASRIFTTREPHLAQIISKAKKEKHVGQVTTTTSELNSLINSYLEEHPVSSDGQFQFYISSSNAVISMDYKFFGTTVPIYVYFQPTTTSDGSVVLTVQSVSAGTLSIPPTAVLSYMQVMKFPDFVNIDPKSSTVKINLNALTVDNLYFHAQKIDLANGKFVFDILQK